MALLRFGAELANHVAAALRVAGDDGAVLRQGVGVVVSILQDDGGHPGFEAVALGGVARLQTQRFDRHHGAAVQGHQAVGGAHKFDTAPAGQFAIGLERVAHDFGDGQFGKGVVQGFLQALDQARAWDDAVVEQGLGFAIRCALELRHRLWRCANGVQFFEQGGGGVAIRVQAHGHGHELVLHGTVSGLRHHLGDVRSQTAWGCKWGDAGLGRGKALGLELLEQDG